MLAVLSGVHQYNSIYSIKIFESWKLIRKLKINNSKIFHRLNQKFPLSLRFFNQIFTILQLNTWRCIDCNIFRRSTDYLTIVKLTFLSRGNSLCGKNSKGSCRGNILVRLHCAGLSCDSFEIIDAVNVFTTCESAGSWQMTADSWGFLVDPSNLKKWKYLKIFGDYRQIRDYR